MASNKNPRDQDRSKPVTAFVMLISALNLEIAIHQPIAVQQRKRVNTQAGGGGNLAQHIDLI